MKYANKAACYTAGVRGLSTTIMIALAIVAVAIAFTLVTSISSLAMPARDEPGAIGAPQDPTPTAAEAPVSQAGSTVAIMWMGIVICAIVLLPMLAHRAMWQKQD